MNVSKDAYVAVQIGIVRHRSSPKIVVFVVFPVLVISDHNVDAWFGRDPVKRLVIKRPAWHGNHADQAKTCHHPQDVGAERPPNAPCVADESQAVAQYAEQRHVSRNVDLPSFTIDSERDHENHSFTRARAVEFRRCRRIGQLHLESLGQPCHGQQVHPVIHFNRKRALRRAHLLACRHPKVVSGR